MSANQLNPGNLPAQKPANSQPGKNDPKLQLKAKAGSGRPDPNSQDELMKRLLEKMVDENPAGIAEIIHLWLTEDKSRNE
jgi:flagellar biosynthesis/type III secretory pathway M-ring protein FliF/YscJ